MSDLPDRFPRGWFVLGHQRDFPIGETKIIFGFNKKYQFQETRIDLYRWMLEEIPHGQYWN